MRWSMKEKNNQNPDMNEILNETDEEKKKEKYNEYVTNMTPKSNSLLNCLKAFLVGGAICLAGEGIRRFYMYLGKNQLNK